MKLVTMMNKTSSFRYGLLLMAVVASFHACGPGSRSQKDAGVPPEGSYASDVSFLKQYGIETIELMSADSSARVLVAPGLQGRVMTSTSDGWLGKSHGWLNYDFIASGEKSAQFNAYGGEERFWLGPEGGPFSIYFDPGAEQVFANWRVPAEIDTEPFMLTEQSATSASFRKSFDITNASGSELSVGIDRKINLVNRAEAENMLGISLDPALRFVAFETVNTLRNTGTQSWNPENGFLSIWLLCMFQPSETGVVFIPFRPGSEAELGKVVKDDYFGKVPAERLVVRDSVLFFNIDGKHRSKIGIPPSRALPLSGSYDAGSQLLTIVWYTLPEAPARYVNSQWGAQSDPLDGDVVNSYNDGPADDGKVMGPFYEIESSSPAALLSPGEETTHIQRVFHISGDPAALSAITQQLFHLTLDEITSVF